MFKFEFDFFMEFSFKFSSNLDLDLRGFVEIIDGWGGKFYKDIFIRIGIMYIGEKKR